MRKQYEVHERGTFEKFIGPLCYGRDQKNRDNLKVSIGPKVTCGRCIKIREVFQRRQSRKERYGG